MRTSSPRPALRKSVSRAGVIAAAIGFAVASATGVASASDPEGPHPASGSEPTTDAADDPAGTDGIEIHRAGTEDSSAPSAVEEEPSAALLTDPLGLGALLVSLGRRSSSLG